MSWQRLKEIVGHASILRKPSRAGVSALVAICRSDLWNYGLRRRRPCNPKKHLRTPRRYRSTAFFIRYSEGPK
eukprot:795319-Pyramimonas_sp.AAC.1